MNNGWFRFINEQRDTLYLKSNAALNDSWRFCKLPSKGMILATCCAIQTDTVLGVAEMVKVITFQGKDSLGQNIAHFCNGKNIRLGQHYGLVRTYDLYHFPDSTEIYNLAGRNDPAIGFQGMTWHDIYNFDVGDEFHYTGYTPSQFGVHIDADHYKIIRRILAKEVSPDNYFVTYNMASCRDDIITGFSYQHLFINDTIIETYPYDSILSTSSINWLPEIFTWWNYHYSAASQNLVPGKASYHQVGDYYTCCWKVSPDYPKYYSDEMEYSPGLGQVYTSNTNVWYNFFYHPYQQLVYYKKGNEEWGTKVAADCDGLLPYLYVTPDTLVIGATGGEAVTYINTNEYRWDVVPVENTNWVTFTPDMGFHSGNVTFTVNSENDSITDRYAKFKIAEPYQYKFVWVRQVGKLSDVELHPTEKVIISPNPIKTSAMITMNGFEETREKQLSIMDLTGREVFSDSFSSRVYHLNRGKIPSGVFFLKLWYSGSTPPLVKKIIFE